MSPAIHQVAAGAAPGDAITNHVLLAQELFRSWGIDGDVFVDDRNLHGSLRHRIRPASQWRESVGPDDLIIAHVSIASPAIIDIVNHAARVAIHYHNITPAQLLWRYAPTVAIECFVGRRDLGYLASRTQFALADSAFNAGELAALGFPSPRVVGVLRRPLEGVQRGKPSDHPRLLFVGRGMPNKAQHNVILAVAALRGSGCHADLTLVGGWGGAPLYLRYCMELTRELGLDDAIHFTGAVTDEELRMAYSHADCFVVLSDHEGFCVPALEAMDVGLPIVASRAGALPETIGAAGLLLPRKSPSIAGEAIRETLSNGKLQAHMARGRASQLAKWSIRSIADRLHQFVTEVL